MMNKMMIWVFAAIIAVCSTMTANAAQDEKNGKPYFTTDELPNMVNFLPPPPEFESGRFVSDQTQHLWGKLQRLNKERADMAIRDAAYGMQTIINEYGGIFGLNVTKDETPEIYTILQDVGATCDSMVYKAKKHYSRLRPYVYYEEGTLVPEKEEKHRNEGSYPSGHTCLGWTMALLMADINPAATDELLARGYEYGQSRVIAGYHWQSDVDAARLAASVLYVKLQGNERFKAQLAKAKEEFAQKTGSTAKVVNMQNETSAKSTRAYTISGIPATSNTRGIIIKNNRKSVRY